MLIRVKASMGVGGDADKQGSNVSTDVSRCYGDGSSSALLGDQLQRELVHRLEIQQQTSTTARYQLVADTAQRAVCPTCIIILPPSHRVGRSIKRRWPLSVGPSVCLSRA